jgi:purine-nucleoside phosphorylase
MSISQNYLKQGKQHTPPQKEVTVEDVLVTLKQLSKQVPRCAIVLGSGLQIFDNLYDCESIAYSDLFSAAPGVQGHSGMLTIGKLHPKDAAPIAVFRGRYHLYEGHSWSEVTLPVRSIADWGVPKLILTNAAGGINSSFSVADVMVIDAFRNCLAPAFRDSGILAALQKPAIKCQNSMSDEIFTLGSALVKEEGYTNSLRRGTYVGLHGPTYETHAEIEMYRRLNVDAVGMSTVPELEAVAKTKTAAVAFSVITNVWQIEVPLGGHEEVLQAGKSASRFLERLFARYLAV